MAKTLNQCWCGCGGLTKSKFVPGHDSKFHSQAKQVARGQLDEDTLLPLPCDEAGAEFERLVAAERPKWAKKMVGWFRKISETMAAKAAADAKKAEAKAIKDAAKAAADAKKAEAKAIKDAAKAAANAAKAAKQPETQPETIEAPVEAPVVETTEIVAQAA